MAGQEEGLALHISEVIEEFSTFGVTLSDEAANQCLALCKQYGVDGEQLAVLWLTFASTHGYDSVTLEALEHLDRVEQNSSRKKAAAEAASASTVNRLKCLTASRLTIYRRGVAAPVGLGRTVYGNEPFPGLPPRQV
ncbi:hypothetical protein O3P69_015186 [Scylla paramamosain]|uniref:DNA polymerase alpha subunit B N-terminal domain-containing protein n=1 Tax=Scylla paramamosain TaxID=85552 RepID=A0AAW0T2Y4_SCYPA